MTAGRTITGFLPVSIFVLLVLLTAGTRLSAQGGHAMPVGGPFVNQAGYNLHEAKRFTAPGVADGTPFLIYYAKDTLDPQRKALYTGRVKDYAGEFSAFDPQAADRQYVIEVEGCGRSVPFWIADHLMEKLSSRLAYQFFIDVRGSMDDRLSPANATGGGPSRDGGGQTLEAVFEGLLYASNPALYDRWTHELYHPFGNRDILVADFPTDTLNNYLTYTVTNDSTVTDPARVPDLIKLMLWHAAFCYHNLSYHGTAGGGFSSWLSYNQVRMFGYKGDTLQSFDYQNMLDQLAAVCAFYHAFLKPYLDKETYEKYRQACLDHWEAYDRQQEVRYWVKSFKWIDKGYREFNEQGNAYGQGLLRNMLMYCCELHEPDGHPEKFLRYAVQCAEDIVQHWDFNNPWHMWAMRNAEHITPQALALFYLMFPDKAPAGTLAKLKAYRDYALKRTANLWQYRTHDDDEWANPRSKEIGTVCGLGGCFFAVGHILQDKQLREVGWSQVNFVFGCNPAGACLSNKSRQRTALGGYWEGVEYGWPHAFEFGTGELGPCRGTMDGSPTDQAFPYHPDSAALADSPGIYGTEGWAISNRAWMSTVTFSLLGTQKVSFKNEQGAVITRTAAGDSITVELKAALNMDWHTAEKGWVILKAGDKTEKLLLTETGPDTGVFRARYRVPAGTDRLTGSYGYLAFETKTSISVK
ncbi:hypothetical protein [Compostibacter hankyongensis]|uniref:Alpha-L-rhamnosidase six-hairpin glycosidase domain-containing protein n=1 Tax=Compostibacter hankyongensis TaxID=1007089 RepID=A0ABP8FGZ8_9BACT